MDSDSRPERHRSGKSFRQYDSVFQRRGDGGVYLKIFRDSGLTGTYVLSVCDHPAFSAGACSAAGSIRKKSCQPLCLQDGSPLRYFDLLFLSDKIYVMHWYPPLFRYCPKLWMPPGKSRRYHMVAGSAFPVYDTIIALFCCFENV